MDAQQLARACADAMWTEDQASQAMGMTISEVSPGQATLDMPVRKDMVNGHNICHGGFIFTLADSAFAFACNSENHNTVAAGARIEFLAPGKLGDRLTAVADRTGGSDEQLRWRIFVSSAHRSRGSSPPLCVVRVSPPTLIGRLLSPPGSATLQ